MRQYILRRLLLTIPTLIMVTIIVFGLLRIMPGDVLMMKMGEGVVSGQRDIEQMKRELGFDKPIHMQYWDFVSGVVRGDLGKSLWNNKPVADLIKVRLPVTFELAFLAILTSLCIAIPVGVISAIRQDTGLDYLLRSLSIAGLSIPSFWLGTLAVTFPAIWFQWIPPVVFVPFLESPFENLTQFIIPALILGTILAASVMRITRTMMLEVMRQDYIRTAWAKGMSERVIIYRHALKNALIPVVTVLGLQMAFLVGGTVVIESIFALPGMGQLLLSAINLRDWPIIQGVNLVFTLWVLLINFIVDLSYAALDPRIRYS